MPRPSFKLRWLLPAAALLVIAGAILSKRGLKGPSASTLPPERERSADHTVRDDHALAWRAIRTAHSSLSATATPADARAGIASLRDQLASLEPAAAAAAVHDFFGRNEDLSLPLPFKVEKGGNLSSHPTLRVALLDILAAIDPAAAATLGRELLESPTTPDEWALALRNVARTDSSPATNDLLRQKTEQLITHPDWQEKPTTGYYEAFDLLVHTRSTQSTPLLSSIIRTPDRKDLRHAAFLTLDRLTQVETTQMLGLLANDEALNEVYPEMVAQQMARADRNNPHQEALVQAWLNDPNRSEQQQRAFHSIYPNANRTVSGNLVTH
jgi:hypothetical protein